MTPMLAVMSEWHIFLVLIIVFLLFGGKKMPELARGIGEAMREFKKPLAIITMIHHEQLLLLLRPSRKEAQKPT